MGYAQFIADAVFIIAALVAAYALIAVWRDMLRAIKEIDDE